MLVLLYLRNGVPLFSSRWSRKPGRRRPQDAMLPLGRLLGRACARSIREPVRTSASSQTASRRLQLGYARGVARAFRGSGRAGCGPLHDHRRAPEAPDPTLSRARTRPPPVVSTGPSSSTPIPKRPSKPPARQAAGPGAGPTSRATCDRGRKAEAFCEEPSSNDNLC